jgi:hypothetical protein
MEFIKIAYCVTVPLLLCYCWLYRGNNKWAINLLAVTNLLLIGNSIFLLRQLWGFYQLSKVIPSTTVMDFQPDIVALVHLLLVMVLPFFFLNRKLRKNHWFSLSVLVVLYAFYPFYTWNGYDLSTKIPVYFCLLCITYALLWLCNQLPYQSSPH